MAAYLARTSADSITGAEIFFNSQGHTAGGISLSTVIEGITSALRRRTDIGISTGLILCFLRHLPEYDAFETLDQALPYKDKIIGVGLNSSEMGYPPSKFKRVFDCARDKGFHFMALAGEEGPPEYVWQALYDLTRHLLKRMLDAGLKAPSIPTIRPISASIWVTISTGSPPRWI